MAPGTSKESLAGLIADLRRIDAFHDLPDDQMEWFAAQLEEVRFGAGETVARQGDPLENLIVILEGEIRIQREDAPDTPTYTAVAGQVTGMLPYSRLERYMGTVYAVLPTRFARLHKSRFAEMLQRMPQLGQRLVAIMSDRIRESTRTEQQRDKLTALGKLSAGLAHELNNPAAAAQRATASLREALETVRDASIRLARHTLSADQREAIVRFERQALEYKPPTVPDPLAQSDREDRITALLEGRGLPDAWKVAPVLADFGMETPQLERLAEEVGDVAVSDALIRIASVLTIFGLIREIENSTRRISDLVRAMKEYSYMDQAPLQEIDLHDGLENTLTIFGHRLKKGVKVIREYDPELPKICAYGGELNQIWTNLIDNAIDAMNGKGELRLRTSHNLDRVTVEIADNGPGIPAGVQPHIFEPFFTTKGVGQGTGLGLDTVCRIIRNHHGEIKLVSKPGDTRFQVSLPVKQPATP